MPPQIIRIYQLPRLVTPATELVGARFEVEVPLGPVPGGFVSRQVTTEELASVMSVTSTPTSNVAGAPQWVAGPQAEGALVFNAGLIFRVKQDIANSQVAPTATNQYYLQVGPGSGFVSIGENQYGTHPAFSTSQADVNAYLLGHSVSGQQHTAPTVTGFLPTSGAVGATVTITGTLFTDATGVLFNGTPAIFHIINATTLIAEVPVGATTGPVSVSTVDATGTSTASFTVGASSTTTPPSSTLMAALAISVATIVAGSPLTFTVTAGGGTASYSYAVTATNNATGVVTVLASASAGSFTPQSGGVSYDINATVTDSAGKVAQATTRTVQVTAAQTVNQIPVVEAGEQLTITLPTSSVALMATASDPDAGDTLTYLWRQITGPAGAGTATGMPATSPNVVVSNLVAGTYQFGFQATDNHGGKSSEDFVVVTVQATTPGGGGTYPKGYQSTYTENAPDAA
jgi:hypothetical protein